MEYYPRNLQSRVRIKITLIGWVNFLPANITKRATHPASKASLTSLSIKPVCKFWGEKLQYSWCKTQGITIIIPVDTHTMWINYLGQGQSDSDTVNMM